MALRPPLPVALAVQAIALLIAACQPARDTAPAGKVRVVFRHQPLWGPPAPFEALVAGFERENPDVEVVREQLPNSSDLAHQFYLTALEGGAADFDVMVIDVVWAQEFARAGWIADLSRWFPPGRLREEFLPGPVDAVLADGRTRAVPWFVDVGVLYLRTDLVPRPPRTWDELRDFARAAMARDPSLAGYVWQGRQSEGLNCNVFEAIWSEGGEAAERDRLALDTQAARAALHTLHGLIASGISPPSVTSASEEEARRVFGSGRAVFMRNWPYAFAELQKPGSPVRGKVALAALPTRSGEPGPGALGGWQLAINARSPPPRQEAAARLIRHLTSPEANLLLATAYARNPARRAVYASAALREQAPFIASLLPAVARARPRPVTAWYMRLTDTLQGEFSAAISGLRPPEEALSRAQRLADHLAGEAP